MSAWLRRALLHNLSLKLISLLLAVLLYVLVHSGKTERSRAAPSRARRAQKTATRAPQAPSSVAPDALAPPTDALLRTDGRLDLDRGKPPD